MMMDIRSLMDRAQRQLDVACQSQEKDERKKQREHEASKEARASAIERYKKEKAETARIERLKRKTNGSDIAEDFVREVAPIFQRMMEQYGEHLAGVRIIIACSKGDASGDYHAIIQNTPAPKRTYHRASLAEWVKLDQERAAKNITAESADDRLERFASTPNEAGHYPSDDECAKFEAEAVDDE